MRMNTQFITRALLVVALLSIFGMAMATDVGNILDLWNIRTNTATLSGSYTQTANIDLFVTNPTYLPDWEASKTYAVGDVVKRPSDGFAYWCNTINSDATFTATNWAKMWEASKGWEPIGKAGAPFVGTYDGAGFKVLNMYISRGAATATTTYFSDGEDSVGLFGFVSSGNTADTIIKNLGVINPNVTGRRGTGSLVGKILIPAGAQKKAYVMNCYAEAGATDETTAHSITPSATVTGFGATGGLVGANNSDRKQQSPIIRYSHAIVTVASTHSTDQRLNPADNNNPYNIKYGGLVGCNESGITEDSYARGDVSGGDRVGGLAGCTINGAIFRSYATGSVTQKISSATWQGGFGRLVGLTSGKLPPGLGGNNATGSCEDCYYLSTSAISPTTGNNTTGTALTEAQFKASTSFANWDFINIWGTNSPTNNGYFPYYMPSSSTQYHFQSKATGTWSAVTNWEVSSTGIAPWYAYGGNYSFNAPDAYNSLSITVLNGHTMTVDANVTIDQTTVASGGKIVVASTGRPVLTVRDGEGIDLDVAGELVVNQAGVLTLNRSSYTLVNGTLTSSYKSYLNLSGELNISGTHFINGAYMSYGDNSKVEYSGTVIQEAGEDLPDSVYDLIINNSAGVTFSRNLEVRGTLYRLLGAYNLAEDPFDPGSYFVADVNSYYSPGIDYFEMSQSSTTQDNTPILSFAISTDDGQTNMRYIKRQWTISRAAAVTSYSKSLTFYWSSAEDYEYTWGSTVPKVYVGADSYIPTHYSLTSNPRWVKIDYTYPAAKSIATSTFVIGLDENLTLPVELSSFTAQPHQGNSVMIQWRTQSETNVLGFSIYRGLDDDLAAALRLDITIPATNTSQAKTYVYYDREVTAGHYYYWLESIDFDGDSQLFGPVNIHLDGNDPGSPDVAPIPGFKDIYPNPFNPEATIGYGVDKGGLVEIRIYNQRGQLVRNLVDTQKTKGWHKAIWDGKNEQGIKVTSGVYFARMDLGGKKYLRKMVMMK